MNCAINFIEIENQVISANYRNLMFGATVVLVDSSSGERLPEPVTRIASRLPVGAVRIWLPASLPPGSYFLMALNGHGEHVAKSASFVIG